MKRRAWNSTLPAPTKPLPRSTTPIRKRGKSRFPKRRCAEYRAWIRTLPCEVVMGGPGNYATHWYCGRGAQCAHVKTQGSGGDDIGNCVPLCATHHREQEGRTARFNAKYGTDLSAIAQSLAARWRAEHGGTR